MSSLQLVTNCMTQVSMRHYMYPVVQFFYHYFVLSTISQQNVLFNTLWWMRWNYTSTLNLSYSRPCILFWHCCYIWYHFCGQCNLVLCLVLHVTCTWVFLINLCLSFFLLLYSCGNSKEVIEIIVFFRGNELSCLTFVIAPLLMT